MVSGLCMMAELTVRGLSKVIRMVARRLYPLILLLVIGCQQAGVSQDKSIAPARGTVADSKLDRQLDINKTALLEGPSEQIRVKAATVMLSDENHLARKILLETLRQSENSAARLAVCKALSQARTAQEPVKEKADFIQPLLEMLTAEEFDRAKSAAEATLLFEYEQIQKPLEKIVTDSSLPAQARVNAIYALQLQPDMRAIFTNGDSHLL